jgi:hypothetical protein
VKKSFWKAGKLLAAILKKHGPSINMWQLGFFKDQLNNGGTLGFIYLLLTRAWMKEAIGAR